MRDVPEFLQRSNRKLSEMSLLQLEYEKNFGSDYDTESMDYSEEELKEMFKRE